MHLKLIPKNAPDFDRPPASKLTDRQRAIVREYFAAQCKTQVAAKALGISSRRVREVLALPAAHAYLDMLEQKHIDEIIQVHVAMALEPEKAD